MTEECGGWKQLCERIINERKAFERYTEFQAHEKRKNVKVSGESQMERNVVE